MKLKWPLSIALGAAVVAGLMTGCSTFDAKQREWIFQPSDRSWGDVTSNTAGMSDVWIRFNSKITDEPVKLHALWHPADRGGDQAPLLLYLHGARWNVSASALRMRRMQELGFSVLGVDYRGFGKSTAGLPSEEIAVEDAQAAWDWLAQQYPDRPRYIFGHSLGGAIAIDLATRVQDEQGVLVEGTFTSIRDVVGTMKWGWLPVGPFITQRFESINKIAKIGSPILVVHGGNDNLIKPELGRRLFDAAAGKKEFVLVEGGSHHNTNAVGQGLYREAIGKLFGL